MRSLPCDYYLLHVVPFLFRFAHRCRYRYSCRRFFVAVAVAAAVADEAPFFVLDLIVPS